MAQVISVANHKGGVGKTTCAVNLSWELSQKYRTLLIDADPQANSTTHLGLNKNDQDLSLLEVLEGQSTLKDAVHEISPKLSILTARPDLHYISLHEPNTFKKALYPILSSFEYIIIDCAPSMSYLTINCFVASNFLVAPIENGFLALEGLNDLLLTVQEVNKNFKSKVEFLGIISNMVDKRHRLTREIHEQLNKLFPKKMFKNSIPRNIKLAEAPSHGVPISVYDPRCLGSKAFALLSKELVKRIDAVKLNTESHVAV